jgi:hypothetical protein
MRISGEWLLCSDLATRPVITARVRGANGIFLMEQFLVDSGADRTVFNASLLQRLQLPVSRPSSDESLIGVGGAGAFVLITTASELRRDDDEYARINAVYAAFTDPLAIGMSVLGRDVLNFFDVILSKRRNDVLLLAPNHRYQVLSR